jgi:hypothetical protein
MSEAELHILKARMLEGRRAKARRGELGKPVPMGYVRRPSGEVALDPDEQAQATICQVFALFQRFRTVGKVLCYLVEHDIRMPVRTQGGLGKGELEWRRANRPTLHNLFGNPIYAGIYAYGVRATDRRRQKPGRPGTGRRPPRAGEAEVFLPDRVPAYISREQFDRNQAQLRANRADHLGPVRAGTALLSGLVVCGRCGLRMTAAYNNAGHAARYICGGENSSYGAPFCQSLKAAPVDEKVTCKHCNRRHWRPVLRLPPICKPSAPPWSNSGVSVWNARNTRSTRRVAATLAPNRRTGWWRGRWSGTGRKLWPSKSGSPPIMNAFGANARNA